MADDGKWELSREKIEERIRNSNQEWKQKGPTRGGRSSGQGVKLLYICDDLHRQTKRKAVDIRLGNPILCIIKRPHPFTKISEKDAVLYLLLRVPFCCFDGGNQ